MSRTFGMLARQVSARNPTLARLLDQHLLPEFEDRPVRDLGQAEVDAFRAGRLDAGVHPKTLNNALVALRAVFSLAIELGELTEAPRVRSVPHNQIPRDFLTPEQARAVIASAEAGIRGMVVLALCCSLALGELRELRWGDVDAERRVLRVGPRDVPLLPVTLAELNAQPRTGEWLFSFDGTQLSNGQCKWPLYRASSKAGLGHIGWSRLRFTFEAFPVQTLAMQAYLLTPV